jgi:tight adherence protein B
VSSSLALVVAIASGAAAAFLAAQWGFAAVAKAAGSSWQRYSAFTERHLRALYLPMRVRDFALRHAAIVLAGLFLGGVILHSWLYGVVIAVFFGYARVVLLDRAVIKRRRALEQQLDGMLQSLANTILVTQNLEDAFATIAQHFDPPIRQEADVLVKQVRLGTPMDEALRDLALRCQSRNVDAIVTALTVGRQTGGELPKVLETTAAVLRETMRVEGVMEAKTSEGKAQVVVMGMLPFVFGGALEIIDPEWMEPLFQDPIGWGVLSFACLLEFVGLVLVRKVTTIDV